MRCDHFVAFLRLRLQYRGSQSRPRVAALVGFGLLPDADVMPFRKGVEDFWKTRSGGLPSIMSKDTGAWV